jgi:UDP-2,3-diacylglucosamine hydrolase
MSTFNTEINVEKGKKIYFASDFHFGIPDYNTSRQREQKVCAWLDEIKKDAQQIYLLGDLFDSWMEYKNVVPKGTIRFLGKLAELKDSGIDIIIFTGNHDGWMNGYFEQELGVPVIKHPIAITINDKKIHLGHGDGVGKGDIGYKLLKAIISNKTCQYIYRLLHPTIGLGIADFFSRLGPKHKYENLTMDEDAKELQLNYAKDCLKASHIDYFIFGHRHIPIQLKLSESSTFINLGDWITHYTFAVFDDNTVTLKKY